MFYLNSNLNFGIMLVLVGTKNNCFLEGTNFILKIKVYKLIKSQKYIKGHKVRRKPLTIWP